MKTAALLAAVSLVAADRTITVYNACPFTIWPAIFTGAGGGTRPSQPGGWQLNQWQSNSFTVSDSWTAGRIWARRDCDFSTSLPGPNQCLDGGCNGGLVCDPNTGTGVPPASLAEFTLGGTTGTDNYDVSLVDGYNLPIRVDNNQGCPVPECAVDLGPNCPAALQGPFDSTGFPVGCKSACDANLSGNPSNSPNCCSGQFDTPQTCPSSGVEFYSYFKNACPTAYAYAYDDLTSLFTCPASKGASYTITFCPAS